MQCKIKSIILSYTSYTPPHYCGYMACWVGLRPNDFNNDRNKVCETPFSFVIHSAELFQELMAHE